jgi:hypothetical protein
MRRTPAVLLCFAFWVAPLSAATLQQLSFNDLVQKSTAIVRAKVTDSYADFRGKEIFTHWKLQIVEQLKGRGTVEVMSPGGSARGYHESVLGTPQLIAGKEYLLFLWTSKSGATYLTGWGQGVFELSKNNAGNLVATRAALGENIVETGTGRTLKDQGLKKPYTELKGDISTAVDQGARR